MEFIGTLLGKKLFTYDPDIECFESDFKKFASQFNRVKTLRAICSISSQLFRSNKDVFMVNHVPVREDLLFDFAYRVIKYCDDIKQLEMSNGQIELALRMCHKLFDNNFAEIHQRKDAKEILSKLSYRQFVFQQKNFNNFARNYYIYTDLWYRLIYAKSIDILNEIEAEIGVPYDHAILFAYALAGNEHGHFWVYNKKTIEELNEKTGLALTADSHRKFITWCSGDYEAILSQDAQLPPFVRYPIIETKTKPVENEDEVFMVISQQFLHDKLTSGLYFYLADRFNKGDKRNDYKEIFGHVFQEYVGELLRYYFNTWKVVPEIKYKKGKHYSQDSVDWFVIKDDKLIMIEVKQSSIFLTSKQNPSMEKIKSDLKKTIIHGVKQLEISENDIRSKKYHELHRFGHVNNFTKLIVTNDPLYNANLVVKTILQNEIDDLNFQIININDFETLLSSQRYAESLFDILSFKALDHNEMDFNEYISNMFPQASCMVEFLEPVWNSFFEKIKFNKNDKIVNT
jgi:hypothetical protein